ncbi:MAG: bile acid:sodium symporter family protein [Verrucomicrobiae bacterium]|nr:bile acid:sodium symporter family protein [Verrucomicrobiae bacterium]
MNRLFENITRWFALWTVLGCVWAWLIPAHFVWFVDRDHTLFGVPLISIGLGLIMFGMGITLTTDDFAAVLKSPKQVALGVAAQFVVMPLLGFGLAMAFALPPGLAVGLILVACCPGGTASNVVTYLARGNLALSVLLTMASTVLAIVLTPLLTGWLAGTIVEIDRWNLFFNMIGVVLVPVLAGVLFNRLLPGLVRLITPWSPVLSVLIVVLIVGGIIAAKKDLIRENVGLLLIVVFLLHAGGFALGYWLVRWLGFPVRDARTVSIEVGMQNSGLGSALASTTKFQAQFPDMAQAALAPVPSAISALFHCLIGSFLAVGWRRHHEAEADGRIADSPAESGPG